MKKFMNGVIGLAGLFTLSCGGGGLSGPGGSLSADQATAIMSMISTGSMKVGPQAGGKADLSGMGNLPSGVTASSVGARSSGLGSCERVTEDTTNADADDYVLSRKYSWNCTDADVSGVSWTVAGDLDFKDKDDTKKNLAGGYTVSFDFKSGYRSAYADYTYDFVGQFEATSSGGSSIFTSDYKSKVKGFFTEHGVTIESDYVLQAEYKNTYTPDDPANPNTSGSVVIEGLVGIKGLVGYETTSHDMKVTWTLKSRNLKYKQSCAYWYDSGGVYELVDGSGNVFAINYNCATSPTYTLNGETISAY